MARVLVTGGAGFIGSHTVDALLALGHDVRVLDVLLPPVHDGTVPAYLPPEVEFIRGDVCDPRDVSRALDGVEVVYHFAAYQDYLPEYSKFFATNSVGTALLLETIVGERRGVELLVVASSQAIYGEGRYVDGEGRVVLPGPRPLEALEARRWDFDGLTPDWTRESDANPHSPYGLSKRDQDDFTTIMGRRHGLATTCLRYSIVQGPRQSFRNAYSGALRSFAVCALNGTPPVIYEDGAQLRDYVSIRDVVAANLLPLERPSMHGRSFNVGGDRKVTVTELAGLVLEECGAGALEPAVPGLFRVGDTRHVFSDVSSLRAEGWAPEVGQREMVASYLAWAREAPELPNTFAEAETRMRALGVLRPSAAG